MKKTIDYYMHLPYPVEIVKIAEEEGGGYVASLPMFGRYALCADGETPSEALEQLEEIKRERFQEYLDNGYPIPEPEAIEDCYSGRFLVRIPKDVHQNLAKLAKKNGCSLNQLVVSILSFGIVSLPLNQLSPSIDKLREEVMKMRGELKKLRTRLSQIRYDFPTEWNNIAPRSGHYVTDDYGKAA